MKDFPYRIRIHILMVIAGGMGVLLFTFPWHIDSQDLLLLATLTIAGILAGIYEMPMVYSHSRINLTGAVLLMAVFLASPPQVCLLAAVVSMVYGLALRRRLWNIFFSVGSNVLSIWLAALLYNEIADRTLLPLDSWGNIKALCLSASSYWLVSSALITVAVAARYGEPFFKTYVANWREVYIQCILMTLLAVLGVAAWQQGALYAFLLLVPAVAVYQLLSLTRLKQQQVIHAIEIIAEVLDRRNPFTFQHSQRVADYVVRIAKQLRLATADVEVLRRAALIHDIGKLGGDDLSTELLSCRGDPTDYQFYSLKQHAQMGALIAREIPAFEEAEQPIRYHHDWYDGSRTSKNHSGEAIPLGARILAVADTYDCLCMANGEVALPYDPIAVEQLKTMGGKRLDPALLAVFLKILEPQQLSQSVAARIARASNSIE
ncbi:MAG: HD-GYP domain-containing protein [Chloroflexota bacterium]|jgi:putative nucleotidyltransferase with HDIG domain